MVGKCFAGGEKKQEQRLWVRSVSDMTVGDLKRGRITDKVGEITRAKNERILRKYREIILCYYREIILLQ